MTCTTPLAEKDSCSLVLLPWMIAVIVICAVVVVAIFAIIIYCYCKKRKG